MPRRLQGRIAGDTVVFGVGNILITNSFPFVVAIIGNMRTKENRKYFSFGAGFKMSVFSLDAAYLVSTAQSNPLDQTLRFTLGFDLDGIKDLFGTSQKMNQLRVTRYGLQVPCGRRGEWCVEYFSDAVPVVQIYIRYPQ